MEFIKLRENCLVTYEKWGKISLLVKQDDVFTEIKTIKTSFTIIDLIYYEDFLYCSGHRNNLIKKENLIVIYDFDLILIQEKIIPGRFEKFLVYGDIIYDFNQYNINSFNLKTEEMTVLQHPILLDHSINEVTQDDVGFYIYAKPKLYQYSFSLKLINVLEIKEHESVHMKLINFIKCFDKFYFVYRNIFQKDSKYHLLIFLENGLFEKKIKKKQLYEIFSYIEPI